MFLLDTCGLSELVKPRPDEGVLQWFAQQDELSLYISSLTLGELGRGIDRLDEGKRKRFLQKWLIDSVMQRFGDRVLAITSEVALRWGLVQAQLEKNGTPLPVIDSLIAATGLHYQLTIVTRNVHDMKACGAALLNPWTK